MKMAGKELLATLKTEKQLGQQALQNLVKRYDYHEHGGAPLLGIDGICIICHGSSGDRAIKNALGVAAKYARAQAQRADRVRSWRACRRAAMKNSRRGEITNPKHQNPNKSQRSRLKHPLFGERRGVSPTCPLARCCRTRSG